MSWLYVGGGDLLFVAGRSVLLAAGVEVCAFDTEGLLRSLLLAGVLLGVTTETTEGSLLLRIQPPLASRGLTEGRLSCWLE